MQWILLVSSFQAFAEKFLALKLPPPPFPQKANRKDTEGLNRGEIACQSLVNVFTVAHIAARR